jgi:hypothetical protein
MVSMNFATGVTGARPDRRGDVMEKRITGAGCLGGLVGAFLGAGLLFAYWMLAQGRAGHPDGLVQTLFLWIVMPLGATIGALLGIVSGIAIAWVTARPPWRTWLARHRAELAACGLPDWLYTDEVRWRDFLDADGVDEETGWRIDSLAAPQAASLRGFILREYGPKRYWSCLQALASRANE